MTFIDADHPSLRPVHLRFENGHQVIDLPHDIRLEGDTAYLEHDPEAGALVIRSGPAPDKTRREWQEIFDALDAAGVPEDFLEVRPHNRIRPYQNPFEDEPQP